MRDLITFTKLNYDSGQAVHTAMDSAFFPVETYKEDRQCIHNVILRRVRATIVAVEKQ
jgi:hypothetical protein